MQVRALVDRAQCAQGNGRHVVSSFDRASFDPSAALADLKGLYRGGSCTGRKYSTSRQNGVDTFRTFLGENEEAWFKSSCEEEWPTLKRDLLALVEDPSNRAVFSAVYDEAKDDNPVGCFVFRFRVYRENGALVDFDFDWAD